jgi:hypothetical protein
MCRSASAVVQGLLDREPSQTAPQPGKGGVRKNNQITIVGKKGFAITKFEMRCSPNQIGLGGFSERNHFFLIFMGVRQIEIFNFLKWSCAKGTEGIAQEKFPMTLARSRNFTRPTLSDIISLQSFTIDSTLFWGNEKDMQRELTNMPRYSRIC